VQTQVNLRKIKSVKEFLDFKLLTKWYFQKEIKFKNKTRKSGKSNILFFIKLKKKLKNKCSILGSK
jgi:hypothetical protein